MSVTLLLLTMIAVTRSYFNVSLSEFAKHGSGRTHVSIVGYVSRVRLEADGDMHIELVSSLHAKTRSTIMAECVPYHPCVRPRLHTRVRVAGISRFDPEHHWWEVHPVEELTIVQ